MDFHRHLIKIIQNLPKQVHHNNVLLFKWFEKDFVILFGVDKNKWMYMYIVYLLGSVFIPIIGLSLFKIFDAASRNVPSPPAVITASAHSRISGVNSGLLTTLVSMPCVLKQFRFY